MFLTLRNVVTVVRHGVPAPYVVVAHLQMLAAQPRCYRPPSHLNQDTGDNSSPRHGVAAPYAVVAHLRNLAA